MEFGIAEQDILMNSLNVNPVKGKLDLVRSISFLDGRYVEVPGDTMTGKLTITPASGETALKANAFIVLRAGQRMVFDGA